ncbi:MAG: class I SAM-dependent methyltransferase family protein [Candidatus Micrarchaeota archaeon]|nr:class I SAM-dependent methyltransferase family protein [Candidatus Micrarchaeota archaeon]
MAKCIRVDREDAEKVRKELISIGLLDNTYSPEQEGKFVYFAVKTKPPGRVLITREMKARQEHGKSLGEAMEGKLTKSEQGELVKSFDIVGDIAVVDVPPSLVGKQQLLANAILKNHKNVHVVAKKVGGTGGEFRIRPVEVIAGEDRTHTVCREAGCEFELDLNFVYFSSRLETERTRIAALVKKGEHVLVPFAGVGPYAIRIAKKVPSAKVVAVELNSVAVEFLLKNMERNKCANIAPVRGDASKDLPGDFVNWADRAIMPHPTDGARFLPTIIPCIKKGGMLHYYSFGDAMKPYAAAEMELKTVAMRLGRKVEVVFKRVARPYSKERVQVVVDAKII